MFKKGDCKEKIILQNKIINKLSKYFTKLKSDLEKNYEILYKRLHIINYKLDKINDLYENSKYNKLYLKKKGKRLYQKFLI